MPSSMQAPLVSMEATSVEHTQLSTNPYSAPSPDEFLKSSQDKGFQDFHGHHAQMSSFREEEITDVEDF